MTLKGKVALITGGGTGIGVAVAERFVSDGAKICIAGRRAELLDQVAKSLPAGTVVTCPGDVSRAEDAQRMVDTAVEFGGRLDVLVNNAGMDPRGSITRVDPEVWRRVIDVDRIC
jgi:NAD(P)-dependent dehydrogenase (short-subunit alcohol dehydrogenase family)